MPGKRQSNTFGRTPPPHGFVPCPRCGGTGHVQPESISIGDRLRRLRTDARMTQAELSPKLGITRAQLANIEADRSRPGLESLVKAADIFHVSVDSLLGRP
jgi:DNA-binding XRE family transcriptional regulator